jgi:hypothetical protein
VAAHAHLELCIGPDGEVSCYPKGDPKLIVRGLRAFLTAMEQNPEAVLCVAGACEGHRHA